MLSEKQILRKFDMSSTANKISYKANLANAETAKLKADNEIASSNFGAWDMDKKKEQFLTIDRF